MTRVRGKIQLEATATPSKKRLIEQFATINARLTDLERRNAPRSRNALVSPPKFNIRIRVDPEVFKESDFDRVKDILTSMLEADDVANLGVRVMAHAPERLVRSETRWEDAKEELLSLPGVVEVGNRYIDRQQ